MTKKFSIKKLVAGALAAAMVVTALPVSGLTAKAAETDALKVYRSYNPNSGEHLYTTSAAEQAMVVAQGRSDEGAKFLVPATSSTPVYRAYNPNSGEHLLVPKGEAEGLAAIGWSNEGIKMYSDDNKGVPIYRVYNPDPNAGAGAHLYTSKEEATALVAIGWNWDNNGEPMIYGINEEITDELALESVEAADGGVRTVLLAHFKNPVKSISPADVEIRRVSNDDLNTVEKVDMSSDGKTATLYLVGFSAGTATPLDSNTDYNLIVSSANGKASKVFSIPGQFTEATVTAIDPIKKTICINGGTTKYTDNSGLIKDYAELLGRTVTGNFDAQNELVKLNVINEKVVYSAITAKNADGDAGNLLDTIVDTDDNEYGLVAATAAAAGTSGFAVAAGQIHQTREICLDSAAIFNNPATVVAATPQTAKFAKIVLNGNGTVHALVTVRDWDKSVYVASVKDDKYLVDASGAYTDVTDFMFMKDGKMSALAAVVPGDVVFVSSVPGMKVAEIYSTNKKSGKLSVYTGKLDIGTDRYDMAGQTVIGDKVVATTTANIKDYDGSEAVAYLNRANELEQVVVTSESAQTTSEFVVITEDTKIYTEGKNYKVSFKGGNGTAVSEYEVNVSDLTKIVQPNGTEVKYDKTNATPNGAAITNLTTGTFGINATTGISIAAGAGNMSAGTLVKVTKNAEGKIVALEFAEKGAADYDFATAANKDMATTQTTNDTFEGKQTALAGSSSALIEANTPVYVYNTTNKTVVLYKYKDVAFTATAAATGQIKARKDGAKVAAFYIDETRTNLAEAAVDKTVRGVVKSTTLEKGGENYAEVVAWVGDKEVTYKDFAQDCADASLVKGDFVDVKLTKDGKVFSVAKKTAATADLGEFVVETSHVDAQYILSGESDVTKTIVVKAADGTYSTKTWSELGALVSKATTINVATYGSNADYVDAVYVELASGLATDGVSVSFPAFTDDATATTSSFATAAAVGSGSLTGLTSILQASTDGLDWTTVGGAATNGIASGTVVTTSDVDVKANTYYRLVVSKAGSADAFVNMTGDKTAAAVAEGISANKVYTLSATSYSEGTTITIASSGAWDAAPTITDQFGDNFTGTSTFDSTTIATSPDTTKKLTITATNGVISTMSFDADLATGESGVFSDGTNTITVTAS